MTVDWHPIRWQSRELPTRGVNTQLVKLARIADSSASRPSLPQRHPWKESWRKITVQAQHPICTGLKWTCKKSGTIIVVKVLSRFKKNKETGEIEDKDHGTMFNMTVPVKAAKGGGNKGKLALMMAWRRGRSCWSSCRTSLAFPKRSGTSCVTVRTARRTRCPVTTPPLPAIAGG